MAEYENWFKRRREELGMTQREMADACGVTEKSVANVENDRVVPSSPIASLAAAYSVAEKVMEREVMALRRRIEAREAAAA